MAVTWTISTLERNTDDGVVVAHWQAGDSETVGTGDDAVIHSGGNYGTVAFNPDSDADGYTAYADITEAQVIEWVKADVDADAVEASIAAQIADSKAPAITAGVPW
jgi:hypothetical protein